MRNMCIKPNGVSVVIFLCLCKVESGRFALLRLVNVSNSNNNNRNVKA